MSTDLPEGVDLSQFPSMQPPPGEVSNFENPASIAYIGRNVMYTFLPLMFVFLALRLFSRLRVRYNFGADDVLCIVAAGSIAAFCGVLLGMLDRPYGIHQWNVPVSAITDTFLKLNLSFIVLYSTSSMLVKVTLLVLYLRIFKPVKSVVIIIYICTGVIAAFYTATLIAYIVQCIPRTTGSAAWLMSQAKCGPFALRVSAVQGVFGPVSDFVILMIPLSLVIPMRLPFQKKLAVASIFLTGLVACACSIVTCVLRFKEQGSSDYTYENVLPDAFAIIELTVGHICCSLPTLPPVFISIKKSDSMVTLVRYLKSRTGRSGRRVAGGGSNSDSSLPTQENKEGLPNIPGGNLTGLRSFMAKAGLTRKTNANTKRMTTDMSHMSNYNELSSIDVDYHAQLRHEAGSQR